MGKMPMPLPIANILTAIVRIAGRPGSDVDCRISKTYYYSMTTTLEIECPSEILLGLREDAGHFAKVITELAALALFRDGNRIRLSR
jgi:hypothetical protein